jgi:GDPmannose 4,6-dehydratase
MKKAIITGINGQDGFYLCKLLLKKNYKIIGIDRIKRKPLIKNKKLKIFNINLLLYDKVSALLYKFKPDEIYHLAENSRDDKKYFSSIKRLQNSNKILYNILDANIILKAKFFYACSSEIFANTRSKRQNEKTYLEPNSLYGLIKSSGFNLVRYYRNSFNQFACSGILYNHDSYLRKSFFIIPTIVDQSFEILKKKRNIFDVNNIYARRDWSSVEDFVFGFWKILNFKKADDYIVSSGRSYSVLDIIKIVCSLQGLNYHKYVDLKKYKEIKSSTSLVGDNKKLKSIGWKNKINLNQMLKKIIKYRIKNSESYK